VPLTLTLVLVVVDHITNSTLSRLWCLQSEIEVYKVLEKSAYDATLYDILCVDTQLVVGRHH